jgi:hypothetical protein
MLKDRIDLYRKLEESRSSRLVAYVTGDRQSLETQIHPEVLDYFVHHLDIIGVTRKITLFLYTRGGHTLAAWSIANLLRQFADHVEVVVPSKAQSGGTLICLGADAIVMTKQATLGPIDPSVSGPLNPQVPGAGPQARVPVSVEAINGFVEFARGVLGAENGSGLSHQDSCSSQSKTNGLSRGGDMKSHSGSSAHDVVYVRHTNSDAGSGFQSSSAHPTALATIVKNRTFIAGPALQASAEDTPVDPMNDVAPPDQQPPREQVR